MASITSADVAREAGLSRATVSYVLNDTPGQSIPESTRRRVIEAAERLGYVPHAGARALRLGRSDVVLFPLGDVNLTHVLGPAINACAAALNLQGFTAVADATSYANREAAANAWLRLDPAAFIDLTMARDDPALLRMVSAGIPRVTFDLDVPDQWAAIDVISVQARKLQFEHVAERGARSVVWAVPTEFLSGRLGAMLRERQELNAAAAGLELTVEPMEQTQESVGAAVDRWLSNGRLPDAVCGYSDDLALPILSALVGRGVDVPRQVMVIGVDNVPAAQAMTPSLSSIDLVVENMGDALAAGVRAAIAEPETAGRCAPPRFQVLGRESTDRRS